MRYTILQRSEVCLEDRIVIILLKYNAYGSWNKIQVSHNVHS